MTVQIQRISENSIRIRFFGNQAFSTAEARRVLFYREEGGDGRQPRARLTIRNPIVQTGRNEFILNVMRVSPEFIREEYRPFFIAAVQDQRPMQVLPRGQAWLQQQINRRDLQWQPVGRRPPSVTRARPSVMRMVLTSQPVDRLSSSAQFAHVGNRVIWRRGNEAQFYTVMPTSQSHYTQHGINPTAARALALSASDYNTFMHNRVTINGSRPSDAMAEFQQVTTDRLRAGLITFIVSGGAGYFGAYPSNCFSTDQRNRILGLVRYVDEWVRQ